VLTLRNALSIALVVFAACDGSSTAEHDAEKDGGTAGTTDGGDDGSAIDALAEVDAERGSTVQGIVTFADAGSATKTSVLLAREADFDPSGFYDKLPNGPKSFDVAGAWSIADVPAGTYWVLAGFANDGLVSASAAPLKIDVTGKPGDVVAAGAQYVVGAVKIASITPKASTASVTIVDVEGEDEYRVTVHDFKNELVYSTAEPPATGGTNVTFAIGVALTVPLKYRVRVRAMKAGVELTRTEDLVGIFTAAPDDT